MIPFCAKTLVCRCVESGWWGGRELEGGHAVARRAIGWRSNDTIIMSQRQIFKRRVEGGGLQLRSGESGRIGRKAAVNFV